MSETTAMTDLLYFLRSKQSLFTAKGNNIERHKISAYADVIVKATELLTKEREQIKSAFDTGANSEFVSPKQYFDNKYKKL